MSEHKPAEWTEDMLLALAKAAQAARAKPSDQQTTDNSFNRELERKIRESMTALDTAWKQERAEQRNQVLAKLDTDDFKAARVSWPKRWQACKRRLKRWLASR